MRELKVPNGWSKEYLGNLSIDGIKNGVFNDPKKVGKGTKLINVVNLYSGSEINTEKLTRLNLTEQEIAKYKVEVGDLFFTRSSLVLDGIARCNIILDGSEDIVYDGHIMRVRPNIEKVIPFYLKEYCLGDNAKGFFMRHAKTTTMTTIGQQEISKLPVLIPPLKEQEKIVSILSTWDKAIELKEKLIEQKKEQKKGLMQRLLTGSIRLSGFCEEWNTMYLEEICVNKGLVRGPFGGALKKEYFVPKGYKVYEQKNAIYKDANLGDYYINENKFLELKRFEVKQGDFIVSCSGTIGRIYKIPDDSPKGVINQALLKITIDKKLIDSEYFYQYFQWEHFQNKIIENTQGGAMQNLVGMDIFRKTKIAVPNLLEQNKIASILSILDKEIYLEEQDLIQKEEQKKALMQQLLTGKIRVKV